jgi:16S rRNA G966 N2-methylase RsmD
MITNNYNIPGVNSDFFEFIRRYKKDSADKLRLKFAGKDASFDLNLAITQIEIRKKHNRKLSIIFSNNEYSKNVIVPTMLAAEQATDSHVAFYNAECIPQGATVIDMTAGLGIDDIAIAGRANHITAIERNQLTSASLKHNCKELKIENIYTVNSDSIEYIKNSNQNFDIIYIDPARRGNNNRRTYAFTDCEPDIISLKNELLDRCNTMVIKASPMLDINETIKQIPETFCIHIVSLNGECKEILIEVSKRNNTPRTIKTVNIHTSGSNQIFTLHESDIAIPTPPSIEMGELAVGQFIYEPNASVMKTGAWGYISASFEGIKQLSVNTHLFVSDKLFKNFPGRITQIKSIINSLSKDGARLKGEKLNICTRNYPLTPEQLKKKLHTIDGGDDFLYGVKITNKQIPILLLTTKII